jgi:hypothetical protein
MAAKFEQIEAEVAEAVAQSTLIKSVRVYRSRGGGVTGVVDIAEPYGAILDAARRRSRRSRIGGPVRQDWREVIAEHERRVAEAVADLVHGDAERADLHDQMIEIGGGCGGCRREAMLAEGERIAALYPVSRVWESIEDVAVELERIAADIRSEGQSYKAAPQRELFGGAAGAGLYAAQHVLQQVARVPSRVRTDIVIGAAVEADALIAALKAGEAVEEHGMLVRKPRGE